MVLLLLRRCKGDFGCLAGGPATNKIAAYLSGGRGPAEYDPGPEKHVVGRQDLA